MKSFLLFVFLIFLTDYTFAQQKQPLSIEVIFLKAKMITFYTDGNKAEIGQDMKIAFFKGNVLFEQKVLHHKPQHSFINFNNTKDGDTIIDDSEPDMTIEKVTYVYYVYKQGEKRGLFYNEETGKTKTFSVDTLFIQSNLGKDSEESVGLALGKPTEEKKQGKKLSEKYYNLREEIGIDTVYRSYDDALKDLPFSISKKLDQEKNSKLTKSLQVMKTPHSLEIKKYDHFKVQFLTEMELFTKKCSNGQLEKFKRYFDQYEHDINK